MLSDLHLGSVGSEARLEYIVGEINSLNPDVVCIAGDFFDTDFSAIKNPNKAIKTLNKISSTYGTYACLGNHDAGKTLNKMQDFLKKFTEMLARLRKKPYLCIAFERKAAHKGRLERW